MAALPYRSEEDHAAAERFWAGRAAARALFEQVAARIHGWGPIHVIGSHSRVVLAAHARFLWCPVAHPDGSLALRFVLARPLDSPRLRTDHLSGRWSHRVRLTGPADLDRQLWAWLRESYEWGAAQPS